MYENGVIMGPHIFSCTRPGYNQVKEDPAGNLIVSKFVPGTREPLPLGVAILQPCGR